MRPLVSGASTVNADGERSMSDGPQPSHLSTTSAVTYFPLSEYWICFHEEVGAI
jgi:hypothetical protein